MWISFSMLFHQHHSFFCASPVARVPVFERPCLREGSVSGGKAELVESISSGMFESLREPSQSGVWCFRSLS